MDNPTINPGLLLTRAMAKPEFLKLDEELKAAGFRLAVERIDGKPIISIRLKEQDKKDFARPEGVYVTESIAGLPPYTVRLFKIERVNGDCSVTDVEITEGEANDMIAQLAALGVK